MKVTTILLLAVALPVAAVQSLASLEARPSAIPGPPGICFPLEIGNHASIPWGEGAFERDPDYSAKALADDVVQILDHSSHTIVHMETLRRAAILVGMPGKSNVLKPALRLAQKDRLLSLLRGRALKQFMQASESKSAQETDLGMALFDIGYFLGAVSQINSFGDGDGGLELKQASKLCADDGAIWLGYCLAGFESEGHRILPSTLKKACELAKDNPSLRLNLEQTVGPITGNSSYDEIVAWANLQSAKGK
ncbi:MAG: hypothetical protein HQ519_15860 [Planctomycetes bacterium]|nr:hypothetical protein [Planctomycetota bacterium]